MLEIDLHVHSIASGHAVNTIYELAKEARDKQMKMIAITEHGPDMVGAPHLYYFQIAQRMPDELYGVRLLSGCEANIIDYDGRIDLPAEIARQQDIVLIGLHELTSYPAKSTVAQNTQAVLRAMELPYVHIVAHPYRREFPTLIEEIVAAACDLGVLLECNLSLFRRQNIDVDGLANTRKMLKLLRSRGQKIVVSSDAHVATELGDDSIIQHLDLDINHKEMWNPWTCVVTNSRLFRHLAEEF